MKRYNENEQRQNKELAILRKKRWEQVYDQRMQAMQLKQRIPNFLFTAGIYDVHRRPDRITYNADLRLAPAYRYSVNYEQGTDYMVYYNQTELVKYVWHKLQLYDHFQLIKNSEKKLRIMLAHELAYGSANAERFKRQKQESEERCAQAHNDQSYVKWGVTNLIKKVLL